MRGESHLSDKTIRMLLEEERRRESVEAQRFRIITVNLSTWNSANMLDALQLHGNPKSTLNTLLY